MKNRVLSLLLLLTAAVSAACGQTVSVCTTSQNLSLINQRFIPVFMVTLTPGDACALNFTLPTDINVSQTVVLKLIQSSAPPYTGTVSAGNAIWPSGLPTVPQAAGAVAFVKCEVDPSGAYCYPLGFSGGNLTAPQVTVLTSGSGTYTTPSGTIFLEVEGIGGGGGGSGSGPQLYSPAAWSSSTTYFPGQQVTYSGIYYTSIGPQTGQVNNEPDTSPSYWSAFTPAADGSSGTATTFGSLTAQGGAAGTYFANSAGSGGSASGGDVDLNGGAGAAQTPVANGSFLAGAGGSGPLGGGASNSVGAPAASSGSGGSGALTGTFVSGTYLIVASQGGNGGGAGGYFRKMIGSPSATYAYSVGAGGAGGAAGTAGNSGHSGASGVLIIEAYQ